MPFSSFLCWHFPSFNNRKKPKFRNGKARLRTWEFASFLSRHFAYSNERKKSKLRNGKARLPTLHSPLPRKMKSPTTKCSEQPQHEPSATPVCLKTGNAAMCYHNTQQEQQQQQQQQQQRPPTGPSRSGFLRQTRGDQQQQQAKPPRSSETCCCSQRCATTQNTHSSSPGDLKLTIDLDRTNNKDNKQSPRKVVSPSTKGPTTTRTTSTTTSRAPAR